MSQAALSSASRVLKLLLETDGPRSGQEMGGILGCSRAAVSKAVAQLRSQGFEIEARSRAGYTLVKEPDLVLPARVEARLDDGAFGSPLIYFDRIDSTNLEGRRRAEQGAPHGACLTAELQTKGRGRLQRRWSAPNGRSLLFSVILRPRLTINLVFGLTSLTTLAVCRAVEEVSGLKPQIKWPNDVVLDGRKLAGVLTEFTSRAEQLEFCVVGVGLNVNLSREELDAIDQPAASILADSDKRADRAELLAKVLNHLTRLMHLFEEGRREELTNEYKGRFWLLDRLVEVRDGDVVRRGVVRGLAADGALLLDQSGPEPYAVRHGDVSLLSVDGMVLKPYPV